MPIAVVDPGVPTQSEELSFCLCCHQLPHDNYDTAYRGGISRSVACGKQSVANSTRMRDESVLQIHSLSLLHPLQVALRFLSHRIKSQTCCQSGRLLQKGIAKANGEGVRDERQVFSPLTKIVRLF